MNRLWLARGLLLALFAVWLGAGTAPWMSDRAARALAEGEHDARSPRSLRGAGFAKRWWDAPARAAARGILREGRTEGADAAEELLAWSARARPLYAPTWLARAQAALRRGREGEADVYAELSAALWPGRPVHLWRVATFHALAGDRAEALRKLGAALRGDPQRATQAVWLARRLESDPERVLSALAGDAPGPTGPAFWMRLLRAASTHRDAALAERIWARLPPEQRAERRNAAVYVEALVRAGAVDRARAEWRPQRGPDDEDAGLSNPGFELPLAQGGLGWRARRVPGARWSRDRYVRHSGAYSLRISFDGSENLAFENVAQRIPVEPGRLYHLTGQWRGERIGSESGPYLEVRPAVGAPGGRARTRPRVGSWDWSRFRIDFRAPTDTRLVEIRVRRDPDEVSQRGIRGEVWIDSLRREPAEGA